MKKVGLIFPNQLYKKSKLLDICDEIYVIEHSLFFGEKKYVSNFHKNKLVLHRASMRYFYDEEIKCQKHYIEFDTELEEVLKKLKNSRIIVYEPKDFLLENRLNKLAKEYKIEIEFIPNPGFLTSPEIYNEYFDNHKYFMTPFYIEQRKRLNILVDKNSKPLHGKWTFDTENRLKIPKNLEIPKIKFFGNNEYVLEAKKYIEKHFTSNLGITDNFIYPINHNEALNALHVFLKERLNEFGPYEDAMKIDSVFNFHSVLSSSINIGIITPQEVIRETLEYAKEHKVNFASLEGFIRQIIGWREFMMIIYERDGVTERKSNFFNHKNKLPKSFYNATTGIKPVDDTIIKANNFAYSHHIERLMVMGNFMCLCEIEPDEIYKWFMEYYIDAYDWVMVPNVYGMSQFADGGLITTKPYVSSSNYILKMSDYKKDEWCEIWDGLFWRFLHKNKAKIASNSRIGMLLKTNDYSKVKDKIKIGDKFLDNL
jgi:deoxyribodipyrimidine photolyase-related protein